MTDRDRLPIEEVSPRYDAGARFFHWLVVLLFLAQVPAGIAMVVPAQMGDFAVLPGVEQRTIDIIYIFHKGLGAVLILVVFARLFWRLTHRVPPWPATMPVMEQRIASQTHWVMYACMVVAVVTGYVHVVGLGFPMELLNALGVPPLIPRMERLAVISSFVHRFTVIFLLGLVAIHIAEVFRHHWVLKDNVLGRMWPPFGKTNPYGSNTASTETHRTAGGVAPD
jgi:cytochrome b561